MIYFQLLGAQAASRSPCLVVFLVSAVLVASGGRKAGWGLLSLLPGAEWMQSSLLAQRHLPYVSRVVGRQRGPWSQTGLVLYLPRACQGETWLRRSFGGAGTLHGPSIL